MDEIMKEFLAESLEVVAQLELDVETLASPAPPPEVLTRSFRGVHTVKGSCGFLGLAKLESIAAGGEHLLGRLVNGTVALTPPRLQAIRRLVAAMRGHLEHISSNGREDESDQTELLAELSALAAD